MPGDGAAPERPLLGRPMGRRSFLWLAAGAVSVSAMTGMSGCGGPTGGSARGKTLTLGNVGWDENVAVANLTKVVLEQDVGYAKVELRRLGVDALFKGVAEGELDAFQDVWLPRTHKSYWDEYGNRLVRLDSWYQGTASLGLTVPDYVEATTIADLAKYPNRFDGKIIGIEPGAGEMKIVRDQVIPGYGLDAFSLVASDTASMLDQLERALRHKKPIVVTLWKPHWAFTVYRIRYLEDPKRLLDTGNEQLYSVVRTGLKQDKPDAYAFLSAISLTPDQLGRLELAINLAKTPVDGVKTWLDANRPFGGQRGLNRDLVQPWIDAAKAAQRA
jgi:glycine betaine/proline transport system substrate-binding protein